ncbi:hypothetical protein Cgig2_003586 [Carnegiea gigantea]|uniref:Uncharacterized protein n=1 Tax=Carnegiea gigantea TaxID=171969 RepID=A0A9Q1GP07_9CARY|nr:hypothetical protein Cgig2_003586 [Carnegiea gigantea]
MQDNYAVYVATVYYIWQGINQFILQCQFIPPHQTVKWIKEQVIHRILYLNSKNNKDASTQIDGLESTEEQISQTCNETVPTEGAAAETLPSPPTDAISPNRRIIGSYASMVDPDEGTLLKFIPAHLINGVKCAKIEKNDVSHEIAYWQSAVLCAILGANPPVEDFDIKYWGFDSLSKIGSKLDIPLKIDKYIKGKIMLKYAMLLIEIPLADAFLEYIEFVNDHDERRGMQEEGRGQKGMEGGPELGGTRATAYPNPSLGPARR